MKFSTKTRYGLRAMLEIAKAPKGEGVFQKDIAARQDISVKYLDHIIYALKGADLIHNVKGKKSGYTLTRSTDKITVYDTHAAFENGICIIDCISKSYKCNKEVSCEAIPFWTGLNQTITNYLKSTSLTDLLPEGQD